jgi:hypothetical protein
MDERSFPLAVRKLAHEALIDLHDVRRDVLQVGQAAVWDCPGLMDTEIAFA